MELMVVLVILVLAAGLVLPRFAAAHSRAALKTGAREVVTTLGYARSQATAEGRSYRVEIDPRSGEFATTCFRPEEDSQDSYVPHVGVMSGTMTLPAGVSFTRVAVGEDAGGVQAPGSTARTDTSGTVRIQFSPDGTVDQAVIVIANEDGDELALLLDQLTGRPRVLETEEAEELRSELGLK
ncbi:MAG: GspH/FimT family pseudopilin [Armatimonadota bacterium]|jgi:Tfp pilus assembly protein FimT